MSASANQQLTIRGRFKNLKVNNSYAIVSSARRGVKAKIFYDLAEIINMPEKILAGIINLSARTISNYNENRKDLEPVYGEHLLKLIALYEKGEQVFGNVKEFNYWLNKPFWNSKEKPIDWMNTPGGVDLIMEELDKLAQGYAA